MLHILANMKWSEGSPHRVAVNQLAVHSHVHKHRSAIGDARLSWTLLLENTRTAEMIIDAACQSCNQLKLLCQETALCIWRRWTR